MVTLLAWMAQRLVSSKSPTRYASAASCNAATAEDWNLKSVLKSWAISLTSLWKGIFLISRSVLFWYFRISRRATVPGLNLRCRIIYAIVIMVISTRRGIKRGKQTDETKKQEPLTIPQNDEEESQFKDSENPKGAKRRRVNKEKKELSPIPQDKECHGNGLHAHSAELADRKELSELNHREVKRRIAAIQAIRDAQIEHVLIQLRLARSMFSKEQLSMPLLQFLKEYCPNTVAVKNAEGIIELEGKTQNHDVAGSYADEREWRASDGFQGSVGPHTTLDVDDQTAVIPTPMGFRFSSSAVKDSFLRSIGIHISNTVFEGNSEIKMTDAESSFQTPHMDLKMQSIFGMTPKTQRHPKRGEMLLSVHGSPLGIYCEDKMDTISESDKEP